MRLRAHWRRIRQVLKRLLMAPVAAWQARRQRREAKEQFEATVRQMEMHQGLTLDARARAEAMNEGQILSWFNQRYRDRPRGRYHF